jgi:ADP-heptose:LPS heptosyltransferase
VSTVETSLAAPRGFPRFAPTLTPANIAPQRCAGGRERATHRILVARTIAAGDIVMSTPLLAALRRAWPDAWITYLVEGAGREAIDANPYVDELLLWDTVYWKSLTRRGLYPLWFLRALALRRLLHAHRFDIFLSLQPEDWSLLPRNVGAPVRIGVFDTFREYHGARRTSRRTRLYTHAFTHEDLPPHRTNQYLLPLRALGLPEPDDKRMTLGYTEADAVAAARFAAEHELADRFVVVAPQAGWPSRCWPAERYAALGDALAAEHRCGIVLIGEARDREALEGIRGRMRAPAATAAGRFGFREMAAVIARAVLLVSGDTGPMHVAAAVGTPYLALFGPTPVAGRAPLAGVGRALAHPVPCGPCDRKRCANTGADDHLLCLRKITAEEARAAAGRLMEDAPAGSVIAAALPGAR